MNTTKDTSSDEESDEDPLVRNRDGETYALSSLLPGSNPVWTPGVVRLMAMKATTAAWAEMEPFVECGQPEDSPEAKLIVFKREMVRHGVTGVYTDFLF